ncbi:hypothetical protein [Pseudonocardia sp. MH-G8]|uniref:hypothetical protein n=1 Tax=Pseudonocardia sp. MH-G8 TaxID=1854588 RepID=UPI000BA04FCF|nr:hypothetical protein [Pseudonocardia sp. MH-G8]OZM76655.1 hypothetical protein CFP66_39775 [Pseudonocardia sp. MH-G8]
MTREPRPALLRERVPAREQIAQDGEVVGRGVRLDAEQRGEVSEIDERPCPAQTTRVALGFHRRSRS